MKIGIVSDSLGHLGFEEMLDRERLAPWLP